MAAIEKIFENEIGYDVKLYPRNLTVSKL